MDNSLLQKRFSIAKVLAFFLLFFYLTSGFIITELHFPSKIVYLGDTVNIALFCMVILQKKIIITRTLKRFLFIFFLLIIWSIISLFFSQSSLLLYIWGFRQTFRFFLFLISCSFFFSLDDLRRIINVMFWLQIPNIILCTFYRFVKNLPVDFIGGIFGTISGVSSSMNTYLSILICFYLLDFLMAKGSIYKFVFILVTSLYIASISDLKVLFVEIVIFGLIAILRTKKINTKTILLVSCGIVIMLIGNQYINEINNYGYREETSEGILSIRNVIANVTRESGYDGVGDVNRGTVIQIMYSVALKRSFPKFILGLGLGSTEFSDSFAIFTSPFYEMYNHLHYQYFESGILFIELGIVGLLLFIWLFVILLLNSNRLTKCKHLSVNEKVFLELSFLMNVFALIMIFYNTTLRMETCTYLLFSILSVPMIIELKSKKTMKERRNFYY